MDWTRMLAYVTGTVDRELLARNEYLAAENRILKVQLNGRLKLSDAERGVLGEIGHRLGRKVLAEVATVARPDTILGWYRKLLEPTSSMARIRTHLVRLARPDFFTAEVMTLRGLVTYDVLFFIHLESRRVDISGITVHPDERWMKQIARKATMEACGVLRDCRYLLHDRDTKFTRSFRAIVASGRIKPLALPARSPNLNGLCRTRGQVGQGGVLVEGDLVRRALLAAGAGRLCRPFPCRAESPGEGQHPLVPPGYGPPPRGTCAVPRAIGRASALL